MSGQQLGRSCTPAPPASLAKSAQIVENKMVAIPGIQKSAKECAIV